MGNDKKYEYIKQVEEDFVKKGMKRYGKISSINRDTLRKLFMDSKFFEHVVDSKDFDMEKEVSFYVNGLFTEMEEVNMEELGKYAV